MKKIFTVCLATALGVSAYADVLKVLCPGSSVEDSQMNQLYGAAISADGKYVCGAVNFDGAFVANAFTGEVKCVFPEVDESGTELRSVSLDGVAIGWSLEGYTYSYDTDQISFLEGPEGTRGILGESISNDGSLLVGSIQASSTEAAYSKDGIEWTKLPRPTDEEILQLFKSVPPASAAKKVSGDGKVILGFIGDFGVPCVWTLNEDGEYEVDLFPLKFLKLKEEDLNDDAKPLSGLSAHFLSLSNNGRYAAMLGLVPKDGNDYMKVPIVYDTQEKSLIVYSEYQDIDESNEGLYPSSIANDGTFVGTIGMPRLESRGSFIMRAGQTQADMFINIFPEFDERYGTSDILGFNVPTGLSADARYIVGYTFYSDDYNNLDTPAYNETYIIDRGETTAVDQIAPASEATKAIYSIDGRCLREMTKGINIIRNADGSISKILKK